MRTTLMSFTFLLLISVSVYGQYKSQIENQPSASQLLVRPMSSIGSILGLLNPENFRMQHNFSFSYLSGGGQGLSLASYTNSMFYKIADPLNVRFDLTLQGSPFGGYDQTHTSDFNKLFLSRAELNYRPWENFLINVQYRQLPFSYYRFYSPYSSALFDREE